MSNVWFGPIRRTLLVIYLLVWCTAPAWSNPVSPYPPIAPGTIVLPEIRSIRDQIAASIHTAQDRFEVPGISLVLVRRDEVLWSEGFGQADRESGVPATASTVYRAGSLTKPLTALATMLLAEAGKIDIDQPLQTYLPELSIRSRFDTAGNPITVRSVLCHHSGLPTDLNKGMWTRVPFTQVTASLREEYTAFPPNLVFSYSNVGFTLLGHMIEQVSGMRYTHYMKQRLFGPIGMLQSSFGERQNERVKVARGYRNGRPFEPLPIRDLPALGLQTSAADLGRFMGMLLSGGHVSGSRVLQAYTLDELFEPQNLDVPLDLDSVNGLGWFIEDGSIPGAGPVLRHGGTTLAFASEMILLPRQGLGIAVLANADGSRAILSRMAEGILKSVLKVMPRQSPAEPFLSQLENKHEAPVMSLIGGDYATDFGVISIQSSHLKLAVSLIDTTLDLIAYPDGWFGLEESAPSALPNTFKPLASMRFQSQIIGGREVVVAKTGDKQIVMGEKMPEGPIPAVWLKRIGNYEIVNPDKDFPLTDPKIERCDGHLCMSYKLPVLSPKTIQLPLGLISGTEAIILGLGRTRGETLRAVSVGGQERLRYSGFIGRKID